MALTLPRTSNTGTQWSTCLLCSDPVLLPNEDSKISSGRNEIIKTLCFHMQMESKEVPKNCTTEMFPFCSVCERIVNQLWESEKQIQECQRKITKFIATIERTVADAELLKTPMGVPGSPTAAGEEKKFTKLRDTILNGYRTKLLMKQKLRENLILGHDLSTKEPVYSHTSIMQDKSIARQFRKTAATAGTSSRSSEAPTNTNLVPNVTPTSNIVAIASSSNSSQEDPGGQKRRSETDRGNNDSSRLPHRVTVRSPKPPTPSPASAKNAAKKSVSWSNPIASPGEVGVYNEKSCTMVISNIRGDVVNSSPVPPVVIKQEPVDTLSPVPVADGKRRRRSLYQGIEIVRVTDHRANKMYLQCSICRHTALITSSSSGGGLSPYQTMTQHITEKHLGKRRRAALTLAASLLSANAKKKRFTCKLCNEEFGDLKSLHDHKATHRDIAATTVVASTAPKPRASTSTSTFPQNYYIKDLECDVCKRPIKGNLTNLLAHKFSHKNNEERQAAIAAGEKGSRNALLRTRVGKVLPRPAGVYPLSKKARRNRKFGSVASREAAKAKDGPVKCQVCFRMFSRRCHLVLHMQGHARRSQLPIPVGKRKANATLASTPPSSSQQQQDLQGSGEPTQTQEETNFQVELQQTVEMTTTEEYSQEEDGFQDEGVDFPDSIGNFEMLMHESDQSGALIN